MESIDGAGGNPLRAACEKLVTEIREFIDLSLEADEHRWEDWVSSLVKPPLVSCWLEKGCRKAACPAYEVENARCWLVAGTMCGCEPTGDFAIKYRSCTKCDVYQEAVYGDPVVEIYEHILTLVHNLKSRQDRLLTMATRDLLTGLFNRNHFNDVIGREVERARRYGESLSFMVIDLDRFKQINDEYGHLHGDGVLRTFAGILESSVRRSDMLSRFGGDEFVVVSPRSDCAANRSLIERVQSQLAAWNAEFASRDYRLSCSIGCAEIGSGMSVNDALAKADRLMFEEKNAKRATS